MNQVSQDHQAFQVKQVNAASQVPTVSESRLLKSSTHCVLLGLAGAPGERVNRIVAGLGKELIVLFLRD